MAPARRFAAFLACALLVLLAQRPPELNGDYLEYSLTTIAFAAHGTPDIRASDTEEAAALIPAHADFFQQMKRAMAAGAVTPLAGFNIGRDGYFSIHPWGYSALAAPPFLLLKAAGADPLKAFQVVNLALVFVLGLCLYRLFQSSWRASVGVALFALGGGALYWKWCSPECMSAAALLGAMILFCTGAWLRAGLLAGLAAMQNPSIVFLAPFAPVLFAAYRYRLGTGWRAACAGLTSWRLALSLAILVAMFAAPFLLSLWQFGVPSLIAVQSTMRELVTVNRLHSLLFDLNQGMVVGVPALMLLAVAALRRRALAPLAGAALALVLAMALPALSAYNWNSGAAGMMRYAFWLAMPLLFVFLARLQGEPRWPYRLVIVVLLVQFAATYHTKRYAYVELSPVSMFVLKKAPGWYNPDPEIFSDRLVHHELPMTPDRIIQFRPKPWREVTKTLYHRDHPGIGAALCPGEGRTLAAPSGVVEVDGGWRYLNGPIICAGPPAR